MNLPRSEELKNKEYRHGLVSAQIEVDLPLQIRALRKQLVGTQPDMAVLTGMKQPRISAMEKPGGAHFTLETLRRLAEAFDVALIVRFAPFSELLDWSGKFSPDTFQVPSFSEELQAQERGAVQKDAPAAMATDETTRPGAIETHRFNAVLGVGDTNKGMITNTALPNPLNEIEVRQQEIKVVDTVAEVPRKPAASAQIFNQKIGQEVQIHGR
jgi:transcriptional regulator with XRE-family HTH domain